MQNGKCEQGRRLSAFYWHLPKYIMPPHWAFDFALGEVALFNGVPSFMSSRPGSNLTRLRANDRASSDNECQKKLASHLSPTIARSSRFFREQFTVITPITSQAVRRKWGWR
ncbi:hypothetical protein CY34DRAFT_310438 [Suillus luteus UH-Slu-Lm8-n1]|uniref:Uncharacterized protein n=1 Tax=Suillus luteus UH-Slu-Lm8-n1 TaxID=930992 RepID=A0A0D0AGJ4_9AGAM|nr:hypothetical protein CY34DRAFT_310438 [Suillus luteus UH-Slu-Lm8-n1]